MYFYTSLSLSLSLSPPSLSLSHTFLRGRVHLKDSRQTLPHSTTRCENGFQMQISHIALVIQEERKKKEKLVLTTACFVLPQVNSISVYFESDS